MLVENLESLGLTNGEAKVYLALLELGQSTVGPLAKKSKVSYSKIYSVLDRLMEKGLASYIVREQTKLYNCVPPARLHEFLDSQAQSLKKKKGLLDSLLPSLKRSMSSKQPTDAEVFVGYAGLRTAYEVFMSDLPDKRIDFFGPTNVADPEKLDRFYASIMPVMQPKKFHWRGLIPREAAESQFTKPVLKSMEIRITGTPTPNTIDIGADRILLTSWSEQPIGVLIHSVEMAENFKAYFNTVWQKATPHH